VNNITALKKLIELLNILIDLNIVKYIFLLLLTICILKVKAQSFDCFDSTGRHFTVTITEGAYNLVLDSFLIETKVDTIIKVGDTLKYIPLHPLVKDTMYIYSKSILFIGQGKKTIFSINREFTSEEEQVIFKRRYIKLND